MVEYSKHSKPGIEKCMSKVRHGLDIFEEPSENGGEDGRR